LKTLSIEQKCWETSNWLGNTKEENKMTVVCMHQNLQKKILGPHTWVEGFRTTFYAKRHETGMAMNFVYDRAFMLSSSSTSINSRVGAVGSPLTKPPTIVLLDIRPRRNLGILIYDNVPHVSKKYRVWRQI